MNSEERSQVSEVLRCRLQAWKVWRRGIKVLPRRSKENGSTVRQEQAPRIQGLALQHVAQRIASLVLQDQNSWLWRQVESNNFIFHLEQRNQFWLSKYTDILWTIERPWDDIVGTWEPYLFPQTWNNRGWRPSPLLGPGHINCSGIAHLLNFQFIASGRYNHAMKAREKRVPCEPVRDQYGQCWNALTGELLTPGHLARTLAETNPGSTILRGGGGDAHTLELSNGLLLHPLQCFSRRDSIEGGGAQASVVDEGGGRFHIIDIEGMNVSTQQQKSEQASAAAARTTNLTEPKLEPSVGTPKRQADVRHSREQSKSISDGPFSNEELLYPLCGGGDASAAGMLVIDDDGVLVQNIVSTIFGGLVILPLTNLTGTSKGDYPEFIRLGLYVGYVLLVVLTFLGLTAKKMAKPAMRVAAGMSIVAVTISAVYEVSEKVYIKGIIGILGAMGTLATALIKWR